MYDCLHVCVHSLMINCTADTMHDTEISPGHTRQLNSTSIKMWDLLVWQGKHPQAPVAVAAKPYYFSELNIQQTMHNILKHHPEFFASEQMLDTVRSGNITVLDKDYFCEELYDLLVDGAESVVEVIKACVTRQPFQLICQRLLHHVDDATLLEFLSGILGKSYSQLQILQLLSTSAVQSSPGGSAGWAVRRLEQYLQLIIFGCVRWREVESLSMHVALAFHFQQIHKTWQAADTLQEIQNKQARLLCSPEASPVHWALLSSDVLKSDSVMYHNLLLSLWAVECTIHHQLSLSDKEQIHFLADSGIHASKSYATQHTLLRPSRKRKSHKHKRRKSHKKSRKSSEVLPSTSDESPSDNDVGIMTPDAGEVIPQATADWQLDMGTPGLASIQVSAQNVPAVLLHHVVSTWLKD